MSRYGAFLSYSRRDLSFARKLQSALEAYRLPKNAGESVATGKPDRIAPIFRDQDEVSASPNLGDTLNQALADSSALIVIASPDSAESKWVNAEIEQFARLGRAHRIFVAIPPYISSERSFQVSSIFPPALRALGEPLAADFRKTCDGWTLGTLKLVAGVAGVDLVRLRDRDAARRLQRTVIASVAAAAVLGVIGVTGANWWQADQRARTERIERSVEAIRANLLSDQIGLGLAYVNDIDRRSVSAEIAAALDRLQLFWNDQLESPADSIAAIPVGSTYSVNDALYYRSDAGAMRMPVEGAEHVFQRAGASHLYMTGNDGMVHRVDAASGQTSIPPGQAEGGFSPLELYELPNGVLIMTNTRAPGASMAGSSQIAHISYPNGGRSGVINMRVHTFFHANADCTKLYFVDGDEGYGAIGQVPVYDDTFVQLLYDDASLLDAEHYRVGVATLDANAQGWREAPLPVGAITRSNFELFADDWLPTRGRPLEEACGAYRLEQQYIRSDATNLRLPSLSQRAWRAEPSIARETIWRRDGGWFDGVSEELFGIPSYFRESGEGRFALYESFGASQGAAYTFCVHPNGGSAQCRTEEQQESEGPLKPLPQTGVLDSVDGLIDMRTGRIIESSSTSGASLSESPDGRTLMSFAAGQIYVYSYTRGAAPTLVRTFSHTEIAETDTLIALNADDALVVTHEGRLVRVDTADERIEWSIRDNALRSSRADRDYLGPTGLTSMAASPNGAIGVVLSRSGARLYELTLGAPLSPWYPFDDAGVEFYRPLITVGDDGSLSIADERFGLVRAAPERRPGLAEPACMYGARIVEGEATPVEVFGDPQMMQRCGFTGATPQN